MREHEELYHIVVVDDDIVNLKTAGNILSDHGMRVTAFSGGQSMLDYVADGNTPDLILLDILMRNMDGFETLRRLRKYEKENSRPEIPVIYLTADEDKEAESKGLAEGAIDFIRKPFDPEALVRRIRNILGNVRKIQELSEEAMTDSLTGLLNRESVSRELERICRTSRGTLFVIDLDSFKLVNDIYGHESGDRILISFAELLQNHFRLRDIVGRIGG
ncbi:MAG: response regulator, partial [Lachnospiraceae bacterium]|nr:response regulator [Lachnospiraceae bacterium]